jgi:hypothetical protein
MNEEKKKRKRKKKKRYMTLHFEKVSKFEVKYWNTLLLTLVLLQSKKFLQKQTPKFPYLLT